MTEIGIAQQRLFDDDQQAQYALEPAMPHEYEQIENVAHEMTPPANTLEAHNPQATTAQDSIPSADPQGTNPSDDWSQSISYNIFDSSSHTPSGQLNRADFIRDSGVTIQTEPMQHLEIRRWTSMQGAASSPHDTEPFSSVISPKVTRAKSDNAAPNMVQPSSGSVDELSLPVTTELPKVEKRGRKKKQVVPPVEEDDELSLPQPREHPPSKPEKRKPGRPPKNAKVALDDGVATAPHTLADDPSIQPAKHPESTVPDAPEVLTDSTTGGGVAQSIIDEPKKDDQVESLITYTPEKIAQVSSKPAKEPKKKKLKRGKTTSVTLTKTYEPGVEDDVIWIDECPITTARDEKPTPKPADPSPNAIEEQPPAPKKRGRKRKKTAEQLEQEATAPPAADEPDTQTASVNEEENNRAQQNEAHNASTTRAQTPEVEDPIAEGDRPSPNPLSDPQQTISLAKTSGQVPGHQPPETPQKANGPSTPSKKGPGKHSPISSTSKVPYRVGLSKKARIAPLLKIIKR